MEHLLLSAVLLLPAPLFAEPAAGAAPGGAAAEDKGQELPKPVIEKRQDALRGEKRFDAYRQAVGRKSDDLKRRIEECKTDACFEEAGRLFDDQKRSDFRRSEPNAPASAAQSDASRDAFYKDGETKMGRAPQNAPDRLKDAVAMKPNAFDSGSAAAKAKPLGAQGTPLDRRTLEKSQPVADLKKGAALEGKPIERPADAKPAVGKTSTKAEVARTQGELNAYRRKLGLRPLSQDGQFGPKTAQAIKDVQRKLGLEQTGVYDAKTREALTNRLSQKELEASTKMLGQRPMTEKAREYVKEALADKTLKKGDLWPVKPDDKIAKYRKMIETVLKKHPDVDPKLLEAFMRAENPWGDPARRSDAGAQGLMQFMPVTSKQYGINPRNPEQSVDAGARMIEDLMDKFGNDEVLAIAGYNAGPNGAALQAGRVPNNEETQKYVAKVLYYYSILSGESVQ